MQEWQNVRIGDEGGQCPSPTLRVSLRVCLYVCVCVCLFVGLGLSIQLWALKRRKCLVAKIDRGKDRMEGKERIRSRATHGTA